MSEYIPHYEPASHSAAKNIALVELEAIYDVFMPEEDDDALDLIGLADKVVEALIAAGVTIPDDIEDPCRIGGAK